jgi:hypothetical protein
MRTLRTSPRHCGAALGAALVVALAASGCASSGPPALPAGSSVSDARAKLGPPTGEHAVGGGTRLEYATGPFGRHTWMLDFDAAGRLQAARQVLSERTFNTVRAGMPEAELRAMLGRPGETFRIARQHQTVWSWRYETPFCILFQVGMGDDGRVVDTGYAPDPMCDFSDMGSPGR